MEFTNWCLPESWRILLRRRAVRLLIGRGGQAAHFGLRLLSLSVFRHSEIGRAILSVAKGVTMELSAVLTPAVEGGFVALNPETGTTSQGETVEEALANLREATELFLEEFPLTVTGRALLTTFHVAVNA